MPNLKELKTRLEKLPQRKAESDLAATFSEYSLKVASICLGLQKTYRNIWYASQVNSNTDYNKKVLPKLKNAVKEAKLLLQEIEKDSNNIQTKASENKVVRLGEYEYSAKTECDTIWQQEFASSIKRWEKLADVVQKLGAKGGQEFKLALDKLKNYKIPQNDNDIIQIKASQKALKNGVVCLGLEGPFGEFLKASVEGGAYPKDLLKDDIRNKIDEFELWDSFKVQMGR